MRILGLDPGSNATGYGIVERRDGAVVHVAHGVLRAQRSASLSGRLHTLYRAVRDVVAQHGPDVAAVEEVFVAASPRAALVLGQARGAVLAALAADGLPVHEYAAARTKQAVSGNGRASKEQVQRMVQRLLALDRRAPPDASDALAAALCHAHSQRLGALGVTRRGRTPARDSPRREAGPVIARIEGVLQQLEPMRVVVDVHGVGYELSIPLSTFPELPDLGKPVALHVHTHAREGAIELYGFATLAERQAFAMLLRASRVGPRLAQTILSGIAPVELVRAIREGDVVPLRAVPGVGTKLAQRLLVELRDRVDTLSAVVGLDGETTEVRGRVVSGPDDDAREQALSALLNLGYSKARAEQVLDEAIREPGAEPGIEHLVRAALRRLAR